MPVPAWLRPLNQKLPRCKVHVDPTAFFVPPRRVVSLRISRRFLEALEDCRVAEEFGNRRGKHPNRLLAIDFLRPKRILARPYVLSQMLWLE